MKLLKKILFAAIFGTLAACGGDDPMEPQKPTPTPNPTPTDSVSKPEEPKPQKQLVKGADISWCTAMEDAGKNFYGFASRNAKECTAVMKELGANAIRLRVLVDPEDGYCGVADVLEKARRAAELEMDIMIAFHYSDRLANAENQSVPKSWEGMDYAQLCKKVEEHTTGMLNELKEANIPVKWVQIGNETNNGMLWPIGQADETHFPAQYRGFIETGSKAARSVYPDAMVVIHLSNAYDSQLYYRNLNLLNKQSYDIVGMSLYPSRSIGKEYMTSSGARKQIMDQQQAIQAAYDNMQYVYNLTGKDCMLAECGLPVEKETESMNLMNDMVDRAYKSEYCLGIFYWEPEAYQGWQNYECGAFLPNGRPTQILDAFSR